MSRFRVLSLLIFALVSEAALGTDRVILIFDASASMMNPGTSGMARIDEAKESARNLAPQFSDGARQVGLVAFGHLDKGCGVDTMIPPGAGAGHRIPATVQNLRPRGFTPLAASLKLAASELSKSRRAGEGDRIVLLTDGMETCGGDPVGTAKELREKYPGLSIHVIGFSVGFRHSNELRKIAIAGGGSLQVAQGAGSLQGALDAVIKGDVAAASPMPELKGPAPIMDPDSIPRELDFGQAPEEVPPTLSQMEAEISDLPAPFKAAPMPKEEPDEKKPPENVPGTLPPEPEISPIPLM